MRSLGLLLTRLVVGGLLAGHGAQKLFGSFGGNGLDGTATWLESLRLRPGRLWAQMAGGSELVGGVLTAIGALNPIGPIVAIGSMLMATTKVHLGKPVWVTEGGAELPLTNMAVMAGLVIGGPGRLSVDGLLGTRVPRWLGFTTLVAMAASVFMASREEIAQGTSDVVAAGAEVHGDPSTSPDDAAAVVAAGTGPGTETSEAS